MATGVLFLNKLAHYIVVIFVPPLAVFFETGCHADIWINLFLLIGWLPGVIHAWWVTSKNKATSSGPWCPLVISRSAQGEGSTGGQSHRVNYVSVRNEMWENGAELSYCFMPPHPGTADQQETVKRVIKEWEKFANIRFVCVESQDAKIRITFDENDASWSHVGRNALTSITAPNPTMNLGRISDSEADQGVILHEFGHVLGLGHEHQSPIRGGLITLMADVIIGYYTTRLGWSPQDVRDHVLSVYNETDVSHYSRPDKKSIMMYFITAVMNKEGISIGPNDRFSDLDKAFVTIVYPPNDNGTNEVGWSVAHALDKVGVSDKQKRHVLECYTNGGASALRDAFSEWRGKEKRKRCCVPCCVIM